MFLDALTECLGECVDALNALFFYFTINMKLTQLNKNELNRLRILNARLRYHEKRNGGYGAYSKQYRDIWKERDNFKKELSKKYYGGRSIVSNVRRLASVGYNQRLRTAARTVSTVRRAQLNKREARRLAILQLRRNGIPWIALHKIMRNN
jgi:hypothetical protein